MPFIDAHDSLRYSHKFISARVSFSKPGTEVYTVFAALVRDCYSTCGGLVLFSSLCSVTIALCWLVENRMVTNPLWKQKNYWAIAGHLLISHCPKQALFLCQLDRNIKGLFFFSVQLHISFWFQVNQRSLGWALGFMINATNLLPVENPGTISIHLIQSGVYMVVVIVGALLISTGVLICTLSAGRMYKQKRLRTQGLVLWTWSLVSRPFKLGWSLLY